MSPGRRWLPGLDRARRGWYAALAVLLAIGSPLAAQQRDSVAARGDTVTGAAAAQGDTVSGAAAATERGDTIAADRPGPAGGAHPDSTAAAGGRVAAAHDTSVTEARREVLAHAHVVRWYEAVAAVGGVAGLMLLDEPVQRFVQHHLRSKTTNDISSVFRQEGEAPYYAGISLGVLGIGLATGKPGVRRAGARLVAAVGLSAAEMYAMKVLVGRSRPNEDVGAFSFHPFTSLKDSAGVETRGSMPSGHVTAAFAVATCLVDDIKSPLVKVLLYTAATGTAFSRINDNRHWLSDTGMGVILGVFSAKVVNGHWQVFGIHPPGFLVTPAGAGIGWNIPLGRAPAQPAPRF